MVHIMIDEYVNGYGVKAYDSKAAGFFIDEVAEERLEALRSVESWAAREIKKELEARQSHAR